jgi:TM2 domain-containing membrane protein YozV
MNDDRLASVRAQMMYDANRKSTGVAYLLLIFLGAFGAHRFYLGRNGSGVGQLVLWLLGWATLFITWIPLCIWLFVDLFLVPGMVRDHNMNLANMFAG